VPAASLVVRSCGSYPRSHMFATSDALRAQNLVAAAAAAGLLAGLGCASSPPVDKTDASSPADDDGQTLEVAIPPARSAPPSDLTAAPRSDPPPMATAHREKSCCKGLNECKGKGNCKTDHNDCKGLNECKGKGGCKGTDC
jgi:hypothetical protein